MSDLLGQWGDVARTVVLFLLDFSWQSSVLIALVLGAIKLFRVRGAATRHFLLVCVLFGVSVLPVVSPLWPRVGVSRFSLRSMSEEGSQIVWRIKRAVFHPEKDRGGEEQGEPTGRSSPPAAVGSSEVISEAGRNAQSSGQPWFRTMMERVVLHRYGILLVLWMAGVSFGLCRLLWGYRILRRMRASARPVEDASVLAAYEEALDDVHLRRKPRLLASEGIPAPMAVGLWSPTILVPDTLAGMLSSEKIRMVLVHELVHVKEYDLWVDLYQRLLTAVWFFHPLVRYLNGKISRACEDRCDGVVLARLASPASYARALLELLERANDPRTWFPAVAGLQCRSRLGLRVGDILDGIPLGTTSRWRISLGVMATCLLVGLLSSITILSGSDALPGPGSVSLSGIVRDPRGAPVEGATVYASRGGSWDSWGKAPTGADGRFVIEGLSPGTFSAAAEVQGYAPRVLLDVSGGAKDLEFVLNEGGAIAGKVVSEEGNAVSEVLVMAKHHQPSVSHAVSGKTDEKGVYRISHLAEGVYYVRVNVRYSPSAYGSLIADPRRADRIVRVREEGTTAGVDFVLIPGRSVSGRMTYRETGKPAAGVPVTLMGQGRMDTMTDEEGRYTFSGVAPRRYWVTTDLEGYAGMSFHRSFDVTMEEDVRDVDMALIRKGAVSVMVRDERGDPIPDARVWYGGGKEIYGMREESVLRTDGEGRCRFEEVCTEWPEPEVLWVDHSEYAFSLLLEEPIEEGEDREVEATLSRGGTLRGRVMDWERKPVSGARIRILRLEEYPIWWYPGTARTAFTDSRGEYRAERLPPGALKVVVDHARPLFIPEEFTAEIRKEEATTWDVSVRPGGTLMGRVVDRQGRPVKGMEIDIRPTKFYQWEIRTDTDGFYRADHLPPREYWVSVRMPYYLWHPGSEKREKVQVVEGGVVRANVVVESEEGS